ncbi:MAG: peptidase M23 [Marinilabiliales bacterium]|nr:MAG: peptidase M23 [Marinilabiliales bacterium]
MLEKILIENKNNFSGILPFQLKTEDIFQLDLSVDNQELYSVDLSSSSKLESYILDKVKSANKSIAIGGYAEDRIIYKKSSLFGDDADARTIHLGLDIWSEANTSIHSPLDGIIHSFQNNDNFGDYGPTIIVEHQLNEYTFYTLYGHLSKKSLDGLKQGKKVNKGDKIAELGNDKENGKWPPHLHFQLITDMESNYGDFPGVCSKKNMNHYLNICLNPELLLNIK